MKNISNAKAEFSAVWTMIVLHCRVSTLLKKGGTING